MIYDHISNYHKYAFLGKRFMRAFQALAELDPTQLKPGVNEIDGENVFLTYMTANALPSAAPEKKWESHMDHADIHFLLEGTESVGYAPLQQAGKLMGMRQDIDSQFFEAPAQPSFFKTGNGMFVVAFPQDLHMALANEDGPCPCKKICVKVLLW